MTAKRRESFLTHMVPSVTGAQKRKLLSDPLFDQRDLFAPASIEAAREAARDVSLYRGAQSRPSTSSGSNQRRQFHSSTSRGRPHSSSLSASRRPPAPSSSGRFQPKKKSSDPPKKRGGFRREELVPSPSIGGCLGHFWPAWMARGVDAWVVEVLREGYRILFSRGPLSDQPLPMPSYSPSSIRGKALEEEFQNLLLKGAIEQASETPGFYSRLFVVQKDSGAWRPIIDLSTLNTYIVSQHFHMETLQSVLRSIRQGDWMISLDLQDAYLQVPIHPESRRYLRFTMERVPYQFRVLCFGLTTAHQVFTRPMAPVSAILHRYGIRMLRYLDDWLILAQSRTTCTQARDRLLHLCEELGLQVNHRKSSLIPSQEMTYLGMQILSVRFIAKPTETRVVNLLNIIRGVSLVPGPPSSSLATSSGPPFVPYPSGEVWDAANAITPTSYQIQVELSRRLPSHLLGSSVLGGSSMVVLDDSEQGGSRSFPPVPDLSFYSDASDVGWGAIIGEYQVSGVWTPSQREPSINLREMMAVQNGLLQFSSLLRSKTIALFCDNVTTVAYLRRSGGTRSQVLFLKAREILLWIESMQITILPQFIQGSLNTRADLLSRPNLVIGSEWTLHQEVVQDLLHQWPAIIDLFATSLTARLPVFFAPAWEPKAAGVDAFLKPWDNLQAYAFPPIAIIRRVLLKLRASHHCDLTLITPFWP